MITDADVKKLEKVFATKKDLIGFAKKKDLIDFVTKRDLKKDINRLDGKIDKVDKKLDRTINYMNVKFELIEEKLMKLDSIDSRLESISDSLAWLIGDGEYKKFDEEHTVLTEQNKRTNNKIDNHEDRIVSLEQRIVTS